MTATFYVGDAIQVMGSLPEKSVDLILTSPPFLALRSYLPQDHPDKALEGGSQATPGAYIDWLLDVVEACARVLAPHGSLCFELGDTYSGSGEGGGDLTGSIKYPAGQRSSNGTAWRHDKAGGWPLAKSLSLIPETFRFAMVYGVNPHTGRTTPPWRLRNVIRWVRPNPPVGALGDKFRPATSELMVFCKAKDRFFDLDAVREPLADSPGNRYVRKPSARDPIHKRPEWNALIDRDIDPARSAGAPPLDWWELSGLAPPIVWWCLEHRIPTMNSQACALSFGKDSTEAPCRLIESYLSPISDNGAPPLDWWNIPLLGGDEETRYGPKEPAKEAKPRNRQDEPSMTRGGGVDTDGWHRFPNVESSNPAGAPPLDWWKITPGGYSGAHYAVFPPELLVKPIKAMCPEKVCRRCGEASRRISEAGSTELIGSVIREAREGLNLGRADLVPLFLSHYKNADSITAQISNWELGKNVPMAHDWELLKGHLGFGDEWDHLIPDRDAVEYVTEEGQALKPGNRRTGGIGYDRGGGPPAVANRIKANRTPPDRFSDCGHGDYRPGLVLDPFAGSGTTLAVATGHGRDAIGIDLDERNYELALDRVGPLILERGTEPARRINS